MITIGGNQQVIGKMTTLLYSDSAANITNMKKIFKVRALSRISDYQEDVREMAGDQGTKG